MPEEVKERPLWVVLFRYGFVIFLAVSLWWMFPDKTQPRDPTERWTRDVYLIPPSQYRARRCTEIAPHETDKYTAIGNKLVSLAVERGFSLLTAAHAGDPACLIVTSLLSGEFELIVNPRLLSTEGSQFVQEESILCRRAAQRRKAVTRLKLQYSNWTESRTREVSCSSVECATHLYTAFQLLNGSYSCSK